MMFNKYIKDNKIINATEKAYEVIYKKEGYIPYVEKPKRGRKKKGDQDVD